MKKIQFNYDLWVNNKDKYDLVTRGGKPAKIYACDTDNNTNNVLVGSLGGVMASWSTDGWYYNVGNESNDDLMMVEKKQTKTHRAIVVAVRYPNSKMVNIEVCPIEDRNDIALSFIKEGFDYQIKEIEFEF